MIDCHVTPNTHQQQTITTTPTPTPTPTKAYRRAVDINPRDYRAWYGLGQVSKPHPNNPLKKQLLLWLIVDGAGACVK